MICSEVDYSVFYCHSPQGCIYLIAYVDDNTTVITMVLSAWNSTIMQQFAMIRSEVDYPVFYCHSPQGWIYLIVYVDDNTTEITVVLSAWNNTSHASSRLTPS